MKPRNVLLGLALLCGPASAADFPEWAYPPLPPISASTDPALLAVPGSSQRFTQGQIDSGYEVADWFPEEHPPMPRVVAKGAAPPVRACAMCHLPDGQGHPESAVLAGLPASYTVEQIRAYADGSRTGPRAASMVPIAKAISDADLLESAQYFAALKPRVWTRVVESETAPRTRLGLGAMRYRVPDGGLEPLGERIITVPEDDVLGERRDGHTGFVEFVPPGSLARGQALVQREANGVSCAACHGPALAGAGDVPGLAGRLALVGFRGLNDILLGRRTTPGALAMKAAIPGLSQAEMIAAAAYLASLPPE